MQVDGAGTDGAPPRQGNLRATEAGQQRSEHQDRGSHGLDQLVGGVKILDGLGIHLDAHLFINRKMHPHAAQQPHRGGDVVEMRDVADGRGAVGEQRGREDRQGRILCAGDAYLARQWDAAADYQFIHRVRVSQKFTGRDQGRFTLHRQPVLWISQSDTTGSRLVALLSPAIRSNPLGRPLKLTLNAFDLP